MTTRQMTAAWMTALALVVLGAAPRVVAGQATPAQHDQHQPQANQPKTGTMTMDCQSMMAARQKVMEEMKAADARLDTLVQTMNSATGAAKVDATAAVVAELVTQRRTMRERMSGMQAGMMQHMMEHMQAGGAQGTMECPMMKQMGSMKH